jgi:hypothetical protein
MDWVVVAGEGHSRKMEHVVYNNQKSFKHHITSNP